MNTSLSCLRLLIRLIITSDCNKSTDKWFPLCPTVLNFPIQIETVAEIAYLEISAMVAHLPSERKGKERHSERTRYQLSPSFIRKTIPTNSKISLLQFTSLHRSCSAPSTAACRTSPFARAPHVASRPLPATPHATPSPSQGSDASRC